MEENKELGGYGCWTRVRGGEEEVAGEKWRGQQPGGEEATTVDQEEMKGRRRRGGGCRKVERWHEGSLPSSTMRERGGREWRKERDVKERRVSMVCAAYLDHLSFFFFPIPHGIGIKILFD